MNFSRTNLLGLGLVVLSFVLAAGLYSQLPESIPTHWNARGEVDDYTPKPWGPFIMPLVVAGVYALQIVIPRISPRGYRMERFQRAFEIVQLALLAFMFLIHILTLLAALGMPVPMDRAALAGIGLLFAVIGNFMGKVTRNFFIGIRTPWTLASEEVWLRTHRLAGKLFVLAGVGIFVTGLLGGGPALALTAIAVACGVPVLYSYRLYRRIEDSST